MTKHLPSFSLAAMAVLCVAGCAGPALNGYTLAQTGGTACRRFAQPGDAKIQIYCSAYPVRSARAQPSKDASCRWLAEPADNKFGARATSVCRNAAQWEEFDTAAVNAGVTCRWEKGVDLKKPPEETCLTAALWQEVEHERALIAKRSPAAGSSASVGSNWPGSGVPTSSSGMSGGSSYGYFPLGTAIGATR